MDQQRPGNATPKNKRRREGVEGGLGSSFRVQSSEFRVQSSEFRVQGFRGSGVQGFRGSGVQGFRGSGVQDVRLAESAKR
jgi:hypothetical protein